MLGNGAQYDVVARAKALESKLADGRKQHALLQDCAKADVASKHTRNAVLESKERELKLRAPVAARKRSKVQV